MCRYVAHKGTSHVRGAGMAPSSQRGQEWLNWPHRVQFMSKGHALEGHPQPLDFPEPGLRGSRKHARSAASLQWVALDRPFQPGNALIVQDEH